MNRRAPTVTHIPVRLDVAEKTIAALADLGRKHEVFSPDLSVEGVRATLRAVLDKLDESAQPGDPTQHIATIGQVAEPFESKQVGSAGATRIAVLRSGFSMVYETVNEACKPGRYRALAMTALEEAAMWAIKSVSHDPIT